jgi:flagellar biosynthesis protein FlgN
VDRDVCRDCLDGLLSEESSLLQQLEEILQREHEVLNAKDLAAIDKIARTRQEKMGALARTEEQRRSLCTTHGESADKSGLDRLMIWCDPQGSLMARLRECAQRAIRCRDLNDRNGTLVAARLKHVEGLLSALTGRSAQSPTYGPNGSAAGRLPSRVLGAA